VVNLSKSLKTVCLIALILIISFYFYQNSVYAQCIGTYYCDNTPKDVQRECGNVLPGTYNGSFSGASTTTRHYWNTTVLASYANVTVSIAGETQPGLIDDLDLRLSDPSGTTWSETGPGSSHSISKCSIGGKWRADVNSFAISSDSCAPYNITIATVSQNCCVDANCDDAKECSIDTCSAGSCFHYTKENYNAVACGYPCASGLQQCFDDVCRATCPDFSASLKPTSLTIVRPLSGTNSSTSIVNITSINNFNSSVSLSGAWVGAAPTGVSFSYNPSSVTPPKNSSAYSDLTVTASSTASLGTFTLRTSATSGSLTRTADLTVNIVAVAFDFNVSVSPSSGSVVQGNWTNATIYVTLVSGSTQWVSLSLSGCPPDAICTRSPTGGNPTYTSRLNISTSLSTPNGTYTITITGTGGGLTRSATYTLTINSSTVCTRSNPVVSISPTYGYGRAGQTLTYTITVTNKDSTACGESTFSLAGIVPSGFSYSFSQPALIIKPVGFPNSNTSYFYVTSNCTSTEYYYHPIRVNVTNTNAPGYFALSSYSYYYVYYHFSVSLYDSPYSGVSGSTRSYRVYVYNYKWTTCPASNFSLVDLPNSVPAGWSYMLGPSSVVLNPGSSSTLMRFNVTSPCSAAPGGYTVRINVNDNSTNINKTASGTYTVLTPSCYIRSTPFFSFGPFSSTLTATFYNLNTTCFPTATLDCGQGTRVNVPISGNQATTTCSYPSVAATTYYTTRANVSANSQVICQTTVVDNPNVFNFSVSVTPGAVSYSGLVGFWPFDEGWGISTADKSGNNNNASLGVTNWEYVPSWTLGKFGYALRFDGSDDYARVDNVRVNSSSAAYNTVAFWMYWTGINNQMPFGWNTAYDLLLYGGCFGFNTGQSNVLGVSSSGLANSWHHIVAIFYNGVPSGATVSLYIDGVKQNIYSCTGSTTASRSVTSTAIISGWGTDSGYKFGGVLDEVKIFNRSLSDTEILREYQLSKVARGGSISALVPVTLLSGATQPVTLIQTGCPPLSDCTFTPTNGNPTYTSILSISTSPSTPNGTYTITITGTGDGLTRSMNYTIEVLGLCTRSNPLLSISPISKDGSSGEELSYSIYLTNNDNIFCSPSNFSLTLAPLFNANGWEFDKADWLSDWQYRQAVTIDNTQNPNTLTEYQVLVTLDTASLISAGKMNTDCSDARFTDAGGSLINYWLESGCNSANTKLWVKVPSIPASLTKIIYVYYGNPSATTQSNSTSTFGKGVNLVFNRDNYYVALNLTNREWVSGGTNLGINGDDSGASRTLPFPVIVYGSSISAVYLSTNGLLRWDNVADTRYSNTLDITKKILTAHWDDLYISTSYRGDAGIYQITGSDALGDYAAYRWATTYFGSTSTPADFEILLYRNGNIQFNVYRVWSSATPNEYISKGDSTNYIDLTSRWTYKESILFLKRAYPEPIVKIGNTLNPQQTRTINLNVTSSLAAAIGTYTFNVIASSGIYSNSTTGNYIISMACSPPNCKYLGQCFANGYCMGTLLKCDNGAQVSSCGDGFCNCGESELNCPVDCAGVYFKLYRNWNLISLPYKKVAEVTGDTCGQDKLYFYYWEGNVWKKTLGIKNIKGGYGYWVNPTWFTKATECFINVTANVGEETTVQDIPQLLKGYNAIGAPYDEPLISQLKGCSMPIKLYWEAYNQRWLSATKLEQKKGYWVYVDSDCTLSI